MMTPSALRVSDESECRMVRVDTESLNEDSTHAHVRRESESLMAYATTGKILSSALFAFLKFIRAALHVLGIAIQAN